MIKSYILVEWNAYLDQDDWSDGDEEDDDSETGLNRKRQTQENILIDKVVSSLEPFGTSEMRHIDEVHLFLNHMLRWIICGEGQSCELESPYGPARPSKVVYTAHYAHRPLDMHHTDDAIAEPDATWYAFTSTTPENMASFSQSSIGGMGILFRGLAKTWKLRKVNHSRGLGTILDSSEGVQDTCAHSFFHVVLN